MLDWKKIEDEKPTTNKMCILYKDNGIGYNFTKARYNLERKEFETNEYFDDGYWVYFNEPKDINE